MSLRNRINNSLEKLYLNDRIRSVKKNYCPGRIDLSSNDYLGLASDIRLRSHFHQQERLGASASRVLCPPLHIHAELESELAQCTDMESALLFGSGYLANIGTLSSLIDRKDIVLSDKYIHASLLDGIRLSMGRHLRVNHNDLDHYESRLKEATSGRKAGEEIFIVTESVFSMDGDIAPIKEIYLLAKRYDATLIIDEAHAIGVFGVSGGGVFSSSGLSSEGVVLLGTLSKSLASYGGFVSSTQEIIQYLISTARSFLFSTALPNIVVEPALTALRLIKEHPDWGKEVLEKSQIFIKKLQEQGVSVSNNGTHIVPVFTGDEKRTIRIQKLLAEKGILISGIRPPTVPQGTSRLRCSLSRTHSVEDIIYAADEVVSVNNTLSWNR